MLVLLVVEGGEKEGREEGEKKARKEGITEVFLCSADKCHSRYFHEQWPDPLTLLSCSCSQTNIAVTKISLEIFITLSKNSLCFLCKFSCVRLSEILCY